MLTNHFSSRDKKRPTVSLCTLLGVVFFTSMLCCDRSPPPGTPENLKADYERVTKQMEDLKKEYEQKKQETEQDWRRRIEEKETRNTDLTNENNNLRRRLLVTEGSLKEIPLVDAANLQRGAWVHVIYILIIVACVVPLVILLWFHANLRERVRLYVMRTARVVPSREITDESRTGTSE